MLQTLRLLSRRFGGLAPITRPPLSPHRMASTLPATPIFCAIAGHESNSAAVAHCPSGRQFTYGQLLGDLINQRRSLQAAVAGNLAGERIAFLIENSYDYVVTLLSIISCDAIALPLSPDFPASENAYILENSEAKALLSSEKFHAKAQGVLDQCSAKVERPVFHTFQKILHGADPPSSLELSSVPESRGGLMLYTSGTTSRPKGVCLSESVLTAQADSLREAWRYAQSDHLLHLLPLHHIHGTVNALIAPLVAGASIEFLFPFNAQAVWQRFAKPFMAETEQEAGPSKVTFFTVVPTIYNRLLASFDCLPQAIQAASRKAISPTNLRLNISGSAALPTPTKQAWTDLSSGNVLLERYGMTEVGMALSCGLDSQDRVDGSVGWPLPNVRARLVDVDTGAVIPPDDPMDASGREREGEIQLRGPTVFSEYWRNPEATAAEFVEADDGGRRWFKTGDVAVRRSVEGAGSSKQAWAHGPMYFIRGRKSTDIIKTGGEKVSALEVERELLSLPEVSEAAVVGLPSEQWGQKVAAVVVLDPKYASSTRSGKAWGVMDMRRALKDRLARYKVPQELKVLEDGIPRNAMGKVNKKSLVKEVFGDQ